MPGRKVPVWKRGNALHNCPAGSYQDIGEGKRSCKLCAAGKVREGQQLPRLSSWKAAPNNFLENSAGDLVYSGENYKGPLLYYDPRFDYSDVHGISFKNADGTYMNGYSPIFTALRKLQMEQHDSPDDCVSCDAGYYSDESGASECKACEEGSFNDQLASTSCTACDAGLIARPENAAFHELMPFACYSAEEIGEYKHYDGDTNTYTATGEDIGLIREESQQHVEDCFLAAKQSRPAYLYPTRWALVVCTENATRAENRAGRLTVCRNPSLQLLQALPMPSPSKLRSAVHLIMNAKRRRSC